MAVILKQLEMMKPPHGQQPGAALEAGAGMLFPLPTFSF